MRSPRGSACACTAIRPGSLPPRRKMPGPGVEPGRPFGLAILSRLRLPITSSRPRRILVVARTVPSPPPDSGGGFSSRIAGGEGGRGYQPDPRRATLTGTPAVLAKSRVLDLRGRAAGAQLPFQHLHYQWANPDHGPLHHLRRA